MRTLWPRYSAFQWQLFLCVVYAPIEYADEVFWKSCCIKPKKCSDKPIFCLWISDINAFHSPPQPGPQLSSSWNEMCSNSSTIANRVNETFLRQVHHRSKMTLATAWCALSLLWNGIIPLEAVWARAEKASRIENNPKVTTCHCFKTCNVHSAQTWWSEICSIFSEVWVIRTNSVSM